MDKFERSLLQDINASRTNFSKTFNLQRCLEALNTNSDINVQVKLISMLAVYLMINDTNKDVIVTYTPLYDRVCHVLSNCPARKITVTLNFITALLFVHAEDLDQRKSLVVYARNMIRSSGCLAAMCELFVSSMMNHDAWRALCRCVAESCRGIEVNQSYCTHLVPVCIQRCSVRNIETLSVLQSLLQNHSNNVDLFIQCNGIALFQREFLQHEACLQLLATIVQSSGTAIELISNTNICEQLRNFLHMYGPQTHSGQWATIILYHTSKFKGSEDIENKIRQLNHTAMLKRTSYNEENNLESSTNTIKFFQDVMREIGRCGPETDHFLNVKPNTMNVNPYFNKVNTLVDKSLGRKNTSPQRIKLNYDYLRHAPRHRNSVYEAQIRKMGISLKDLSSVYKQTNFPINNSKLSDIETSRKCLASKNMKAAFRKPLKPNSQRHNMKELSFTFMEEKYNNIKDRTCNVEPHNEQETGGTIEKDKSELKFKTELFETHSNNNTSNMTLNNFEPKFVSTPKKSDTTKFGTYKEISLSCTHRTFASIEKTVKNKHKKFIKNNRVRKNESRINLTVQENKKRSISGRFFDVINESCTTFMKTVKNIFKPKNDCCENNTALINHSSTVAGNTPCSYSFTKYMRKRDAVLRNETTKIDLDFTVEASNSCHTCNDTITLKEKLVNDKYLIQTVRKLKLGINLYGCDFKKISRTMWPQDSYMTPAILYNLYRKLLIK